jgi:prevent-host-death family protein
MYNLAMTDLSISQARGGLAAAIKGLDTGPVTISRHGKPVAVVLSPSSYEKFLEVMADAEDIAAYDAASSDLGPLIPWEEVKKDLGLV